MFDENEKSEQITENMEQENKVTIEEASVNFGCVKKELVEEFEFAENQYKVALTYENKYGANPKELRNNLDSLIGFSDDAIVMKTETGTIKLEDVNEENENVIPRNMEQFYCNRCGGNYEGYCSNCSSLTHILNNLTPNINSEPDLNSTPINILEVRVVLDGQSVFALKNLPNGIILGPFEGIASIESMNGLRWKIKNKKFLHNQHGNWMKYIESVANHGSKNLEVFQIDGILYFETIREIQEGEELLVCYEVEEGEVLKLDKEEEFYLAPVKREDYPKVFACTLCCLGFCLESCLMEHKSKCRQRNQRDNIEDFEIIQCDCCKVWLEKREYVESHMLHCLKNYNRLSHNLLDFRPTNTDEEDKVRGSEEISPSIDVDPSYSTPSTEIIDSKHSCEIDCRTHTKDHFHGDHIGITHSNISEKEYKCSECPYQTNIKSNLKSHLNIHNDIKPFECGICKKGFKQKHGLKYHVRNEHSNTSEKEYKCSECSYQTNDKSNLKSHLNTHKDTKPFECDICKQRFTQKRSLKLHIRIQHRNTSEKEYKCSECLYQTSYKYLLRSHLNTHTDIKPFKCDICKKGFTEKRGLKVHIRNHHSNTSEKEYKCSECLYQTDLKGSLRNHLNTHKDIKPFECDICKKGFTEKRSLKKHIRNHHSDSSEKEYKCFECCYQTSYKQLLKLHSNTHTGIKAFECDICKKRFTIKCSLKQHIQIKHSNTHTDIKAFECDICVKSFNYKSSLNKHVRNHHSNSSEKEYKCSECHYHTKDKSGLKRHLNTHNGSKPFECDICKKRFAEKGSLKNHIKYHHSNTSEKEYKCSDCPYQTNYKHLFRLHLNTHTDINPFECDICNKRFTQTGSLKLHIRNHHSNLIEKDYKCSECCYQSNDRSCLRRHLNTHKDIKPFECDICKKGFNQKGSLKQHVISIHSNILEDVKPFECAICNKRFTQKSSLKQHLNTHNDIKPFECDICKKGLTRKSHLRQHVRNHHSNTSEKEYKCSECLYQTNDKRYLKQHLNTHKDNKPFVKRDTLEKIV